ncbi:hypothetical protein NQD34_018356 [Periophthalmus magnuspinnatus]|nr:hypothetical protein NQD34_018356 [Periophthalmus magnuspinnatus]
MKKAVDKPAQYIALQVNPDQRMMSGNKVDPCAVCSLHSIGKICGAQNKQYSKRLRGLLKKHLEITTERIYINFVYKDAADVPWNNTTFG